MLPAHLLPLADLIERTPDGNLQKALTVLLNFGINCESLNDNDFPHAADRHGARLNFDRYYNQPHKMRDSWMKEFVIIAKKAIRYLCSINMQNEQAWHRIVYGTLYGDVHDPENMKLFFSGVIAITCCSSQTESKAA